MEQQPIIKPRPSVKRIGIVNIFMASLDTEYFWTIPRNCVWFRIQSRTAVATRIATERGIVATPDGSYYTLKSGHVLSSGDLDIQDPQSRIYFANDADGKTVEIIVGLA